MNALSAEYLLPESRLEMPVLGRVAVPAGKLYVQTVANGKRHATSPRVYRGHQRGAFLQLSHPARSLVGEAMGNRKWLRIFPTERDAATALAAFSRSAAAGDSLERLLELAAEDLFKLAQADRVGVWLGTQTPQVLDGVALDIHAKPAPAGWRLSWAS